MTDEELKTKLLEVESGKGSGDYTSNWHRNPEGPQAVARIEELEALVEQAFREGDNESGGPPGLDPWEGSYAKEALDKIKGTGAK